MTYFSFIDQHPTEVPTPKRPVDAAQAMTDWIREDRQARQEAVADRMSTVKRIGARAVVPIVALAIVAGIIHEAGGAASQEEAAAAHTAAPIEKGLDGQLQQPPVDLNKR